MPMSMTMGSLFSGIGGFDLAWERAGGTVAWQCEIAAHPRSVLAEHWPHLTVHQDIKEIHGHDACTTGGDCPSCLTPVDVLAGGFPCQDLSVAGRRAGLAGERSGLFYEFARLAEELSPQWIILENVPGLLSSNRGRDMGAIVGTLVDLGYGWAYRILDAQFFGVPQRRRRVFIVGCAGDPARAAEVLLEPEGLCGNPAPSREARARVASDPEGRLRDGGAVSFDWQAGGGGTDASFRGKSRSWIIKQGDYAGSLSTTKVQAIASGVAPTLESGTNNTGGTRPPGTTVDTAESLVPEVTVAALTANGVGTCGADDNQGQAGHLVPTAYCATGEATHAVTASAGGRGGVQEDGTGRGVPVVAAQPITGRNGDPGVVAFHQTQDPVHSGVAYSIKQGNTKANGRGWQEETSHGLQADRQPAVAFSCKDHGADAGETSPTLRAMGHDQSHMNGGGQVAVAYNADVTGTLTTGALCDWDDNTARNGQMVAHSTGAGWWTEGPGTLRAQGGGTDQGGHLIATTKLHNTQSNQSGKIYEDYATSIDANSPPPALLTPMAVRRLTPMECERLQGFPDGWTASLKDSGRYRALGNAVAVPVVEWVCRRLLGERPRVVLPAVVDNEAPSVAISTGHGWWSASDVGPTLSARDWKDGGPQALAYDALSSAGAAPRAVVGEEAGMGEAPSRNPCLVGGGETVGLQHPLAGDGPRTEALGTVSLGEGGVGHGDEVVHQGVPEGDDVALDAGLTSVAVPAVAADDDHVGSVNAAEAASIPPTIMAIHSWASNAELVADAARLGYLHGRVLDATYGMGTFWKAWRPEELWACDLDANKSPCGQAVDFRDLPFPDRFFDCVVLDPPYKLSGTPSTPEMDERYGTTAPQRWQDVMQLIRGGITECARVLGDGYLLVKCADQVCSGKKRWQSFEFANHAATLGLGLVDRFDMTGHTRPQPAGRRRVHAASSASTLLVLKRNWWTSDLARTA